MRTQKRSGERLRQGEREVFPLLPVGLELGFSAAGGLFLLSFFCLPDRLRVKQRHRAKTCPGDAANSSQLLIPVNEREETELICQMSVKSW